MKAYGCRQSEHPDPEALACSKRRSSAREMLQRGAYETTGSRTMAVELIPMISATGPGQSLNIGSTGVIQVIPDLTTSRNSRKWGRGGV